MSRDFVVFFLGAFWSLLEPVIPELKAERNHSRNVEGRSVTSRYACYGQTKVEANTKAINNIKVSYTKHRQCKQWTHWQIIAKINENPVHRCYQTLLATLFPSPAWSLSKTLARKAWYLQHFLTYVFVTFLLWVKDLTLFYIKHGFYMKFPPQGWSPNAWNWGSSLN